MNKFTPKNLIVAAALIGIGAAAQAQTPGIDLKGTVGYVIDARGYVAKSGTGLCWKTGYFTPAMAIPECDSDLAKQAAGGDKKSGATPVAAKATLAADALFDFNKAVLRPEGKAALDKLVADIKGITLEVVLVVGHADRIGKDAYNLKLSDRRAAAVKDYLVGKGLAPNRVYTEGKGEKQPALPKDANGKTIADAKPITAACKGNTKTKKLIDCLQPDRRVEIEVIGTK